MRKEDLEEVDIYLIDIKYLLGNILLDREAYGPAELLPTELSFSYPNKIMFGNSRGRHSTSF